MAVFQVSIVRSLRLAYKAFDLVYIEIAKLSFFDGIIPVSFSVRAPRPLFDVLWFGEVEYASPGPGTVPSIAYWCEFS